MAKPALPSMATGAPLKEMFARIGALRSADRILEASAQASAEVGEHAYLHFLKGRAHLDKGDLAPALEHLQTCLRLGPGLHWAQYELARALALAERVEAAGAPLQAFLAVHEQGLNAAQLKVCENVADRLFAAGRRSEALPLYQRLAALGATRQLSVLRAFEAWLDAGDLVTARTLLAALGEPADAWGHLALARFHAAGGEAAAVGLHACRACELAPDLAIVALAALQQLRRVGLDDPLPGLMAAWRERLAPADVALLGLMAARGPLRRVGVDQLALALASPLASKWPFIEHLYAEAENLSDEEREAGFELLQGRFPGDPDLLMCLANVEVAQRRFSQGKALCEAGLAAGGSTAQQLGFRFKLFEIECFCNRLDEAQRLLQDLPAESLDAAQRAAVARYHAERDDWPRALALLAGLLDGADDLPPDQRDLVVRTARRTGSQHGLLLKLAARGPSLPSALASLAAALFEDLVMSGTPSDVCAQLAGQLAITELPLLAFKLASRPEALRTALAATLRRSARPRRAVFFCADKAYVMPAAVSLSSLLEHNAALRDADFHLVIDDPLIAETQPLLDRLAAHHGVRIACRATSGLVPRSDRLSAAYGVFTGGHQLAVAAYYRIYMARALAESGDYDQLLYVDADTVAAEGFEELFSLPCADGALLRARLEVDRQEVRAAIAAHGLVPGSYFNSGVPLFPRVQAALVDTLRRVERVAEERHAELFFQDQCALNIGFAGAVDPLPERFNFFAGPRDAARLARTALEDLCLMHVLDRPKPWDSAYPASAGYIQRRWLHAAQGLQRVLGLDGMRRLADASFS